MVALRAQVSLLFQASRVLYMTDLLLGVKAEEAAGEDTAQPQVDYLTANRNINTNQLTVSSVTSGNLALYEVCPPA